MEKQKTDVQEYVKKIVSPIFNKALQEKGITPESVGWKEENLPIKFTVQPHDCRLYFDFSKEGFNHKKPPEPTIKEIGGGVLYFNNNYTYRSANYDKEHHYFDFMGCTLMVKKNQIQINVNTHKKQWRLIESRTIKDMDKRIDQILGNLANHAKLTLKTFINLHGGQSNIQIKPSSRCEIGIHGHDFLDNIPERLIIRDTYFKKLYKEKIEIYEDMYKPARLKQTMTNLIINDVAPDIASEISNAGSKIKSLIKVTNKIAPEINNTSSQLKDITKTTSNIVQSQKRISEGTKKTLQTIQEKSNSNTKELKESLDAQEERIKQEVDEAKAQSNSNTEELKGALVEISKNLIIFSKSQAEYAKNNASHLALINGYRGELLDMKKPFFVRWWEYFKKK